MFFCERGQHISKPGEKCIRVIVERRQKEYRDEVFDSETKFSSIRTGVGWEIAKEIWSCPRCAPRE